MCGNFIGLSCSFHYGAGGKISDLNGCGPIYDLTIGFPLVTDVGYGVTMPALTTSSYDTNIGSCGTATFAVAYKSSAGATIAKPAWLTQNTTAKTFTVSTSSFFDISVVTVVLTATTTLLQLPVWTLASASKTFTIDVHHACYDTTINSKTLNDMSINVTGSTTQSISFTNTIATYKAQSWYCGSCKYSLAPSHGFLSISGTTLTLSTSSVSDAGTYNVTLTVGLALFSTVASITVPLTVTIAC